MKLVIVSNKKCWQDENGRWVSSGGFPLQMRAIASLFHEVTLLIVHVGAREGGIPLPEHARVVPLRQPAGVDARRKLSVVASLPYYWRTIASHTRAADAVHVPVPGDLPLLAMGIALLQRKRLLARYCASWPDNSRTTAVNRFTKWLMRRTAGGRNVMLATGSGEQAPAPRMRWIFSSAVSRAELASSHRSLDREFAQPPRAVVIGRVAAEKGLAELIRVIARLRDEGFAPLPRFTLLGDGPQRAEYEQTVASLSLADQVHFAGMLPRAALMDCLTEQDFAVHPSYSEGFSKAWIDALAAGLPVLSTDVGSAGDVLGRASERGWLIPPRDEEALYLGIKRILTQPVDWPAMRRRCREYVDSHTIEAWSQAIGEICAQQWGLRVVEGKLAV